MKTVRERILTIQLINKMQKKPEYAGKLGLSIVKSKKTIKPGGK